MTSPDKTDHQQYTGPTGIVPEQAGSSEPAGLTTAESTAEEKWAICCSGGGFRSASYSLGALQSLQETGLLAKAKWTVGVSGGSYIAASRALVAHDLAAAATGQPAELAPSEPAYAPGTPEERNLRLDTRYIAPNGSTVLVGAFSLLLGVLVTFVLVLAPVYALAHAWGWLLRWQGVAVPAGGNVVHADVTALSWWLPSVILSGITLALFVAWWLSLHPHGTRHPRHDERDHKPWWVFLKPDDRDSGANRATVVAWATVLTAGVAVAMLGVPMLISWLMRISGPVGTIARDIGFGTRPSWSLGAVAGLVGAIAVIAKFVQGGLAKWNAATASAAAAPAQAAAGKATAGQSVSQSGVFAQVLGWLRQKLMPWLASAIIVACGVVLALLWTTDGLREGYAASRLWGVLGALAVMAFTRIGVDVNRMSLHDVYRWRLADAFAVTRQAAEETHPVRARMLFNKAAATRLSQLRDPSGQPDEPGLVICGTVNINAAREVPRGQDGLCLAFDAEHVTLRREKGLKVRPEKGLQKGEDVTARTADYEALMGERHCALFDVSAISGAAISPLMGAATQQAYRILLTCTNIRLGVWLPHPALVHDARELLGPPRDPGLPPARRPRPRQLQPFQHDDEDAAPDNDRRWAYRPLLLLLWYLSPHLLWDRRPNRNQLREVRLWAHVLDLRESKRPGAALWLRVMQPTLGLLWAEAAGKLSYRSTWMNVTDGGDYENLGLVEALHRGADRIVVIDASGDAVNTWSTLGNAIALARADAGIEITLDPTTMWQPGLAAGEVNHPWVSGTFARRPGNAGSDLPVEGRIWVCKLGWWKGAPWDVLAYARGHPTFPCDSTLEQLFDVAEFEAYHQLGTAAANDAAEHCEPALKLGSPATQGVPVKTPGPAA